MRALFPTRAILLLLGIGVLDLAATVLLHAGGKIEERNPLMAPILARGAGEFSAVKAATLLVAWAVLVRYDRRTVRRVCLVGSAAYLALLGAAFFGG